jgi:amino acid transporter
VAVAVTLVLAVVPARRGTNVLLSVEGATVALILIVTVIVLVRLLSGSAPGGHHFTLSVFTVPPGTSFSPLFLGVVFGFLSFAGFEAAATLGEEATHPTRDIPRAILGTAVFGGIYFVLVTAVEMMGFGTSKGGVTAFASSPSLLGDLGTSYVGAWIGDIITLGTTISAFGCCLASTVGASRLMYALARDAGGFRGVGRASRTGAPATATLVITGFSVAIYVIYLAAFHANAEDSFAWSGTIGTLILLVAYVLATIGCVILVFVRRKLPVPMWQVVVPLLALVVLGYTLYRNVIPYPPSGPGRWFPVVAGGWLVVALLAVIVAPGFARRLGAALTASEGIAAPGTAAAAASAGPPAGEAAGDVTGEQTSRG